LRLHQGIRKYPVLPVLSNALKGNFKIHNATGKNAHAAGSTAGVSASLKICYDDRMPAAVPGSISAI
jgi:hypothetical protein